MKQVLIAFVMQAMCAFPHLCLNVCSTYLCYLNVSMYMSVFILDRVHDAV